MPSMVVLAMVVDGPPAGLARSAVGRILSCERLAAHNPGMRTNVRTGLTGVLIASTLFCVHGTGVAQTRGRTPPADPTGTEQTVLGPGLYVFQTRTRSATCGDDERTGYVSSFVAPIHGVPGSREMRMQLLNTEYWPSWAIEVTAADRVVGHSTMSGQSGPSAPENRFDVSLQGDRFTGQGTRTYTRRVGGRTQQCSVTYDALLRRIDQL